jgi:hypothetical protein
MTKTATSIASSVIRAIRVRLVGLFVMFPSVQVLSQGDPFEPKVQGDRKALVAPAGAKSF